jgi:glycerol-3-phosphate dehydrogenase
MAQDDMQRNFNRLSEVHFDLVVIGGGIYGAWTAYEGALRGLQVALVDKGDWGSGTSSASSKLIHGGFRYLAQNQFGLVRRSLHEREWLVSQAPQRARPDSSVVQTVARLAGNDLGWSNERIASEAESVLEKWWSS